MPGEDPQNRSRDWRKVLLLSLICLSVSLTLVLLRFPIGIPKKGNPFQWSLDRTFAGNSFNVENWEWVWRYAQSPPWWALSVAFLSVVPLIVVFSAILKSAQPARRGARAAVFVMFVGALFLFHIGATPLGQYGYLEKALTMIVP